MLFKQVHLEGIKAGSISLAFRKWKKLSIKKASLLNTAIGLVEIDSIEEVDISAITASDALQAGFSSLDELIGLLNSVDEGQIYRIGVAYHSPDPRIMLRNQTDLEDEEFQKTKNKLERLDKYSKVGDWTTDTLRCIQNHPRKRAAALGVLLNKEKEWLKINIRKLKNLGLTISHETGYEISPLGSIYLARLEEEAQTP